MTAGPGAPGAGPTRNHPARPKGGTSIASVLEDADLHDERIGLDRRDDDCDWFFMAWLKSVVDVDENASDGARSAHMFGRRRTGVCCWQIVNITVSRRYRKTRVEDGTEVSPDEDRGVPNEDDNHAEESQYQPGDNHCSSRPSAK